MKTKTASATKKVIPSTTKKSTVAKTGPVRNTPIPKPVVAKKSVMKKVITPELIAERAYFISISPDSGSQDQNWHRAERELRGI